MATVEVTQSIKLPHPKMSTGGPDPAVKLIYFNLRGRAEPARLLLAYAGMEYEDKRIPPPWEDPEGWAAQKSSYPFGVLPVMHWNGVEISEGVAVARFLAKEFGLAGRNDMEAAQIDEIVCAIEDVVNARINFLLEKDEQRKKTMIDTFQTRTVPTLLSQLEKRLILRGGQFYVGNILSWADIQTFMILTEFDQDVVKKFPKVANLVERIGQIPNIKKWVESRPASPV